MPHSKSAAYQLATRWLYDRIDYERMARPGTRYRFTLDRMRELIRRLGHGDYLANPASKPESDPRTRVSIVHIAGTKGKGSVATMTAAMLTAAGHRVGLYTSPHLVNLEERFRVNGCPASPSQMTDLIDSMRPIVQQMSIEEIGGPTFFELTTAIAIEHFHRCDCDFWVLETGLGGRLDSTNVFQSNVSLISSIGLDHQHVLGNTVEKIAKEKAGIFKPGVPAVSGVTRPPARDVIRDVAQEVGAPLVELGRDFQIESITDHVSGADPLDAAWGSSFELAHRRWTRDNTPAESSLPSPIDPADAPVTSTGNSAADATTTFPARTQVSLSLEGQHQIGNAAIAIVALNQIGISVGPESLDALSRLQIEARLERFRLPTGPTIVLDAAHNPDSIAALVATIRSRFAGRKTVGVFGTSVDKDANAMLDELHVCLDQIILTRYHGNPRFVPIETLATAAQETAARETASNNASGSSTNTNTDETWFSTEDDPLTACQTAIESAGEDGVVVICGSFFLAAELRPWLSGLVMQEC
ncbi:dihydrofolate synthase/folylpolyglutamate synthase [Rhodopirellula rubra]|uniref:Dihydrofolate synthase/folylpolyglutamate synthase n=1 Tax=Aporhodopirellula rubra TaxID=980271 RepID=A0A7W5DYT1_9BACT|nr:folylpolyglutamate synthase/dihydrofolate synthase family protein [Aporhodopirellula rubra]MBB3206988.1 dihydrofolate synthase/folylpolyglutamate synthase [Aporhodopirellula rubra]